MVLRRGTSVVARYRHSPALVVALAMLIAGLLLPLAEARAEERFALVIGNAAYKSGALPNPANDAELMDKTLTSLGFKVTRLVNGSQSAMKRSMLEFSRKLRATQSVGLFYYAGHGVQVEGENYLVPVDANIQDESEVPVEALNLNDMFKTMERSASRINIAILDACRNNPFRVSVRSGRLGLAPVQAPTGSFIAYATAPGQVAKDGDKGNSPYTRALSTAMQTPGLGIEEVFRHVRRAVLAATDGSQTPWESSSLTGQFYFKQKPAQLEANRRPGALAPLGFEPDELAELKAWQLAHSAGKAADYQRFLENFPSGLFAEIAEARIARLKGRPAAGTPPGGFKTVVTPLSGAASDAAEALMESAAVAEAAGKLSQAAAHYFNAALLDWPPAMAALAKLYDKGRGVPRSLKIAASWYRKAADHGHVASMNALGNMYEFGEGVPKDIVAALRYYQLAAEKGDANGMTSLAFLYATGKGVTKSSASARKWYLAGAEKGGARAMFNLALMQIRGDGGDIDYGGAAIWLKKAVAKGHAGAMRQLAALHEGGHGVGHEPRQAAGLLLRSFIAGNKDARNDLVSRPESWSLATRKEVQRELRRRGLYKGRTSGYFNRATRQALLALLRKA